MKGMQSRLSWAMAAEVLAICMRESTPSCIRAPPEAETRTSGDLLLVRAPRQARDLLADDRAHRSAHEGEVHHPEVERQPVQPRAAGVDARRPRRPSSGPRPAARRSARSASGSTDRRPGHSSRQVPGSVRSSMYSSAPMRRCRPHSGQTLSAFSNFSRMSMCPQPSHFSHASGGISSRSRCDVRGLRSFLNHAITAIG